MTTTEFMDILGTILVRLIKGLAFLAILGLILFMVYIMIGIIFHYVGIFIVVIFAVAYYIGKCIK